MTTAPAEILKHEVLRRAKEEAQKIISNAEARAREIIERARVRKRAEIEEERKRVSEEVGLDAMIVEARRRARMIVAEVKNKVLEELVERIRSELNYVNRKQSLRNLLVQALDTGLFDRVDKIIIKVVKSDKSIVEELVQELDLKSRIAGIEEIPDEYLGGVIIESADGSVRVDNTYARRLERILKQSMPQISRDLFGSH